jgi:hypothetical protein
VLLVDGTVKFNQPLRHFLVNRAFWIVQCQIPQFLLCTYTGFLWGTLNAEELLEDLGIYRRIILKDLEIGWEGMY